MIDELGLRVALRGDRAIELEQIEHDSLAQVVASVNGRDVTRGELAVAFQSVVDKANWKNPINRVIDLDQHTMALVREAVIFFTGSVPTFHSLSGTTTAGIGLYRVTADGYYRTCGA